MEKHAIIPIRERKRLRDKEIRALYKLGYSMDQICLKLNLSKTTVFFAIKGRGKRSVVKKDESK